MLPVRTAAPRKTRRDLRTLDRAALAAVIGGVETTITPRDPATGLPTGKRQHKPFTY
jgi:hypothetical protein